MAPPNATPEQLKVVEDGKIKDLTVKNYLFHSIDRSILEIILVRNTSKDVRDPVKRKYQDCVFEQKKGDLELIWAKYMKIMCKNTDTARASNNSKPKSHQRACTARAFKAPPVPPPQHSFCCFCFSDKLSV
ncbi:hypothetical protein MTR_7g014920 [Medicago truncatula]|uniref:Uncharacterized protein n=1 Tax=Medicago truncatula TaxID=3880 RepID=A0A072TXS3_MEDTR|nr:hypothetical protein MTR_7g014920 [Medicago truncatula]